MQNTPAERTNEICAAIEKLVRDVCDESERSIRDHAHTVEFYITALGETKTELKEAERKAKLHREFWQDSRRKRERLSAEIRRLLEQNKALKACLSKEAGSESYDKLVVKILEELKKSKDISPAQGNDYKPSITLRVWKHGETPLEGDYWSLGSNPHMGGNRLFYNGKTVFPKSDSSRFLIGPLPESVSDLFGGEGDGDE